MQKQIKNSFKEIVDYRALDSRVLAVAVAHEPLNDWAAYIGAVPGRIHEVEYVSVKEHGSKLSHDWARMLFPEFNRKYVWRD